MRLTFAALILAGCAAHEPSPPAASPAQVHAWIDRSLPEGLADRAGWAADLNASLEALDIAPSREHVCAVAAVIAQESGFKVDPPIPALGVIAWREIDRRAARAGVPAAVVHEVLTLGSPTGVSYAVRIDRARTEKELSDIFEDFTGSVPLGRSLFASWNPIRTRGPMQVNVAFAERFSAAHRYPYPVTRSIDDELFTRRGSLYFGTAHLLDYEAPYDRYVYRFADFNAGQYASRNAAFQLALARVAGKAVTPDGALVPHDGRGGVGGTELAARALAPRLRLGTDDVHAALEQSRSGDFERSALYRGTFRLAERTAGHALPRAVVPRIELEGPKLEHRLTTEWYAQRVDGRFHDCLAR